jgi:HemY protein
VIRLLLFFVLLAAASFGFAWLADRPGQIVLMWQGYRIETSLLIALGAVAVLTIALIILWSLLRFVFRIPAIMSITERARRTNKGYAAISKGMVAAAIGDAKVTEKAAREASKHLGNVPLASLLQAQSAQIAGDHDRAIRTFNQMLENDETRVLGLRGLYLEASRNGDSAAAHVFAKEAYGLAPLPWAGQALLEHHAMADDWSAALAVVESSIARKAIDKKAGNRQRGVLKTGIAMDLSGREPDEALRIAREAIKLAPDLIPAYVTAGRLLARKGDIRRAGRILEDGWRVMPHPDIARAYLDLRPGDSAADRLSRARTLTKVYSEDIEARLTLARTALEARDFDLARKTMEPVFASGAPRASVRACLLMADMEETEFGDNGQVREWLARATRAARDPMWIADGIVTDTWAPASPVSGKLDAFVWEPPVERLSAPLQPEPEKTIAVIPHEVPAAKTADRQPSPASTSTGADKTTASTGKPAAAPSDAVVIEAKPVASAPANSAAKSASAEKTEAGKPAATAAPTPEADKAKAGAAKESKDASKPDGKDAPPAKPPPAATPATPAGNPVGNGAKPGKDMKAAETIDAVAPAPDVPAQKSETPGRTPSSPPDDPGPRKT